MESPLQCVVAFLRAFGLDLVHLHMECRLEGLVVFIG